MPPANPFQLVLLAAIWGASFLFVHIGAPVFGPGKVIALRVSLVALLLFASAIVLLGTALANGLLRPRPL